MINKFYGKHYFLSNFYPLKGILAPSLEHHFQASKTNDLDWVKNILNTVSAKEAKQLGRLAPLRKNWEEIKDNRMLELVRIKFQDLDLCKLLLATLNEELI